ncbi:ADP-ribose pyrophosphatase YjhB, NUDIX family [Alkalibacterium putridalgicola]|uniref:ADP-ribose pyrophosphatase YjhB, NUDIX family n=1 Tax=Alkalibacterium putridalgicola TaxID=426703 RepID=A0A1H7US63_9LACT|nr:CoA pyrophosphatase [Alkalibacterium putridalgicola]GEK88502.1 coenzyme A pyrophosphatase [Alkalibacterium putridalgicola]SEL99664.1 ADP-ribose pyrophosphatase YjhB, NUDIX family [Alkalibacterium putridalgicola]
MIEKIRDMMADHQPDAITKQSKYAVLLPLVRVNEAIHILYEVRSHRVSQPGETSFPGGALETGETFEEAALRETEEELVLDRGKITVLGEMDYIVKQNHIIKCFVGWLPEVDADRLEPNEEVEAVFTIPLDYFLTTEPKYYETRLKMERDADFPVELISGGQKYKWRNVTQQIPFYRLSDHYLWGYTAHLTHRFSELIKNEANKAD